MPNARDIQVEGSTSHLIIADGGHGKTYYMGTCPKPFIFDFDNGMKTLRGKDIDFETYFDAQDGMPKNEARGCYEWGTSWTKFQVKLNEIGALMDKGQCPYETLCFDSLTTLADLCMNYVLKSAGRNYKTIEQRDWGSFLNLMKAFAGTITSWPIQCVLSAHIKRDENLTTGVTEKLPLISGQFSGIVPIYFDEVYYVDVKAGGPGKPASYTIITQPNMTIKMAKSRLGVPSGTPLDHPSIMAAIAKVA